MKFDDILQESALIRNCTIIRLSDNAETISLRLNLKQFTRKIKILDIPQKNWQVYILRCRDDTLYTGITNDLENRLQSHNEKRGARYTRTRLPVTLVYSEQASSRSLASRREAAIKKLPRSKKLKLIAESGTVSQKIDHDP